MHAMALGAGSIAHLVHYAVLGGGVLGMLLMLAPGWAGEPRPREPRDDHERRVLALQRQISNDTLGTPTTAIAALTPIADRVVSTLLPIAIISSTAAAGVHAAVGPAHFRESTLFGIFFAGTASLQIVWSLAIVLRPGRLLLGLGVLGNAAMVVLWAITRTLGLPFGLLPRPEDIGAWDVCCGLWELITVGACVALLRRTRSINLTTPRWDSWPSSARVWLIASSITLGALSLSAASS